MKELPAQQGGNWYERGGKMTKRLEYEILHMKAFFDVNHVRRIKLPRTSWDVSNFDIRTCLLRLHPVKDAGYPLGWDVQFSMDDGGKLSKPNQVWTIKLFYPNTYPFAAPITSLLDERGHILYGDKNRGTMHIEGIDYLHSCLYETHSHDAGKDHAAVYAARSIEWLRSALYSKKKGGNMPFYV